MSMNLDVVRDRASERLGQRLRDGHARQQSARRAYALIRSAIRTGDLPQDAQLCEDRLVRDLDISRNAIRSALQKLGGDGIVMRRPRVGTVVVSQIGQFPVFECSETFTPNERTDVALVLIDTLDVPATAYLSAKLGDDVATFRMSEFLIMVGEEVIGIFSRYGRCEAPALEQPAPALTGPERTWYRRIYGEAPGAVDATIEAVAADDRTARLLGAGPGHPLLVRETLYRDRTLNPVELHYCFFDSRRAALRASA
ncbi:GntR family transcriptional regulator [Nocardioides sp. cx-169]|uniref:GntR family transcriptional regulator n=1 Tax=Nocardioides sp. cx-169 TaxID=2899080 RepID=UPI001E55465E|nr:GntR family transcriptional regulator [Nocardioides sp. cx-169]MCD4532905.1 GntR family transcriptional regulator [Nocardioides sp. cx-169]